MPRYANYDDTKQYTNYTWRGETDASDPKGQWDGTASYWRTYTVRVPRKLLADARRSGELQPLRDWIERNSDKNIWR